MTYRKRKELDSGSFGKAKDMRYKEVVDKEGEQKRNKYHSRRGRVLKVTYTNVNEFE